MINVKCEYCSTDFAKTNSHYRRSAHHYCSKSCANRANPRRSPEGSCKDCGKSIRTKFSRCGHCDAIHRADIIDTKKLADTLRAGSNRYGNIRSRANTLYGKFKQRGCQVCGYTHHVDVCHIQEISKFSPNTLVGTINSPTNIALLCKNCHWELDHDLIPKESVPSLEKWCAEEESNL